MTINTNDVRNEYTASAAQTIFNYTFKIYDTTDLNVYVTPAGQVCAPGDLTTAYTITGVGLEAGGSITLTTGTTNLDLVTIVSSIPDNRTTDYQNNGDFRPSTVNDDIDRVVSLVKQNSDKVNRTVAFEECEQGVSGLTLPPPLAGAYWRMKTDLTGMENILGSTGIPPVSATSVANYTALRNLSPSDFSSGDIAQVTDDAQKGLFKVVAGTSTDNEASVGTIITNSTWNTALKYWVRIYQQSLNPRWGGADNSGAGDSAPALLAQQGVDSIELSKGTYTISSTFDLSTGKSLVGKGHETILSLSGNSKTAFSFSDNTISASNLTIDGNKPTVGWETTNNFDFGIRMGSQTGAIKGNYLVSSIRFKDLGMDGIIITNTNFATIGDCHFENCRRTSIAVIDGDTGTSNVRIHDIMVDADFGGGPVGKEYPLFAFDIEPDGAGSGGSANGVKKVTLDGFHANQGRVSSFRPAVAVLEDAFIRNGLISGALGQLSSTNDETTWSNIGLVEDAYINIDTDSESAISRPWLSDITINRVADDEVLNATDGRHNLLTADWIHIDDGILSQSGTGVTTTDTVEQDGKLLRVTNFGINGTGVAAATFVVDGAIAIDDNVIVTFLFDRVDANSNVDTVMRVNVSDGGSEVLDRTYSIPVGVNQWATVAVKSPVNAASPDLFIGLSGTTSAATNIRIKKCFVFVNPKKIDFPSLKVGDKQQVNTFTGTLTGCTTSPTGTIRYTQEGSRVMLEFSATYGTSNTVSASLTGMPESIRPSQGQTIMMAMTRDNGTDVVSGCMIATTGVITLFKAAADNGFTNSGSKGISECTLFYSLI